MAFYLSLIEFFIFNSSYQIQLQKDDILTLWEAYIQFSNSEHDRFMLYKFFMRERQTRDRYVYF